MVWAVLSENIPLYKLILFKPLFYNWRLTILDIYDVSHAVDDCLENWGVIYFRMGWVSVQFWKLCIT